MVMTDGCLPTLLTCISQSQGPKPLGWGMEAIPLYNLQQMNKLDTYCFLEYILQVPPVKWWLLRGKYLLVSGM